MGMEGSGSWGGGGIPLQITNVKLARYTAPFLFGICRKMFRCNLDAHRAQKNTGSVGPLCIHGVGKA